MTDPIPAAAHPPEFVQLCQQAIGALEALKADPPMDRGKRLLTIETRSDGSSRRKIRTAI